METTEFIPRILGLRESELSQALSTWQRTIDTANETLGNLAFILEYQEDISISKFMELLSLEVTEKELAIQVYLEKENSNVFGNMDISKMFDLKLLNQSCYEYISYRKKLKEQLREAKRAFSYPLEYLYDDNTASFQITETFMQNITDFFTLKTSTSEENKIVDKVLKIVDGLNELMDFGILKKNRGIENLHLLPNLVKYQKGVFVVNPRVLTNKRFIAG